MTIGPGEALRQACMTAHDYMLHAQSDIAEVFGPEQAKNPVLVAAYMNAATVDYHAYAMLRAAEALESIASSISEIARNFPLETS